MRTLTLQKELEPGNLSIDLNKVTRIKLDVDNPKVPRIWVLYFYGQFRNNKECVIGIWFFYKEEDRSSQLERILNQYPHIQVK